MSTSFLLLAHKNLDYIYSIAEKMRSANFYIHLDLKADDSILQEDYPNNIYFIDNRVDIKWAGFSMVQATLNLINYALNHDKNNEYFHLISADDVILNQIPMWESDIIFMECIPSSKHRYRVRFNTIHADTKYQRSVLGKVLTLLYKTFDKLYPSKKNYHFGSQWFSIHRKYLEILINSISDKDIQFFRKKLCPDEHFFQYLICKNHLLSNISPLGNMRYIQFNPQFQHGSSPIWLNLSQLRKAQHQNFWFARKVTPEIIKKFYRLSND